MKKNCHTHSRLPTLKILEDPNKHIANTESEILIETNNIYCYEHVELSILNFEK